MNPARFFLYTRKSTDEEERQILSIESQVTELREFARKEQLTIAQEFTESMSAKVPGRPIFNRMMEMAERQGPVGLLAWHPDRLARNSVDGGRIVYLLDTGKLSSLRFPTFWFENTPQGKFMLTIAFGQSKYYVDNLIENVWRGIRQKLRRGEFPAKPPVGYLNEPRLRTIVVNPAKAQLARQMFEAYASGRYNFPQLRALVASWGLVTRSGKPPALASVKRLLMNQFYVGLFHYNGELYQGSHEPLIPRELFDRVQEVMARRGRAHAKRKHLFPFVGLLHCGECGCAITAERQKGHHYYRCTKKKRPCSQPYVREEALAAQLRQAVQTASLPDAWAEKMLKRIEEWRQTAAQASGAAAQPLRAKLTALEAKADRLLDAHLDEVISREEYAGRKEKLLLERSVLSARLAEVERQGNHWLEPLERFVRAAHQAHSVAAGENLGPLKEWTTRIGSNP
jgi:DNA invertase Pin-like site-specific DNA recombinase